MIARLVVGFLDTLATILFFLFLLVGAGIGGKLAGLGGALMGLAIGFVAAAFFMGLLFLLLEINQTLREIRFLLEQYGEDGRLADREISRKEPRVTF